MFVFYSYRRLTASIEPSGMPALLKRAAQDCCRRRDDPWRRCLRAAPFESLTCSLQKLNHAEELPLRTNPTGGAHRRLIASKFQLDCFFPYLIGNFSV
jgi:hypothetical protein